MREQGFTLMDMAVTTALVGTLSATLLPKFVDMTEEAKEAAVKTAYSATVASVELIRMKSVLVEQDGAEGALIADGQRIELQWGYPTPTEQGITSAIRFSSDFELQNAGQNRVFIGLRDVDGECGFHYQGAVAQGDLALVEEPSYSGC